MAWLPGTLVAVIGGTDNDQVRRICRVVSDLGATVLVESDSKLEGDAAVEYDFPTPEPCTMEVDTRVLREIKE